MEVVATVNSSADIDPQTSNTSNSGNASRPPKSKPYAPPSQAKLEALRKARERALELRRSAKGQNAPVQSAPTPAPGVAGVPEQQPAEPVHAPPAKAGGSGTTTTGGTGDTAVNPTKKRGRPRKANPEQVQQPPDAPVQQTAANGSHAEPVTDSASKPDEAAVATASNGDTTKATKRSRKNPDPKRRKATEYKDDTPPPVPVQDTKGPESPREEGETKVKRKLNFDNVPAEKKDTPPSMYHPPVVTKPPPPVGFQRGTDGLFFFTRD